MKSNVRFAIVGAGGIGRAVGLILRELSDFSCEIYIGDLYPEAAESAKTWISSQSVKRSQVHTFTLQAEGLSDQMRTIFESCDVLLDCLPGSLAPRYAGYAKEFSMHYANLTEYVKETEQIESLAKDANTGFLLQTGLAPGFINVLALKIFEDFKKKYEVEKVSYISMNVGALTRTAISPHYYGFTWSPVGVATEYIHNAIVIRNGSKTFLPALSERAEVLLKGELFESDLTSGGAADLPDFLAGKTTKLDYKTLRYPGHYDWIQNKIDHQLSVDLKIDALQGVMEACIPHYEDDRVVIYVSVIGKDSRGTLRIMDKSFDIRPKVLGGQTLRAIQLTTAAPLAESAMMLVNGNRKGVIHQSSIPVDQFMKGKFVQWAYGS